MSNVSRRDAVKLAAAGLAVGAGVLAAREAHGQGAKKYADAAERWKGHTLADPKELQKATKAVPVSMGVEPPGDKAPAAEAEVMREMEAALAPMGVQPAT